MRTQDFDYYLPAELIAQTPVEPRDSARLLVVNRDTGKVEHDIFRNISSYLRAGDVLVFNETRVIPARLFANKIPAGGRIELLLLNELSDTDWEVIVGGKGLVKGKQFIVEDGPKGEILAELHGAERIVRFSKPVSEFIRTAGHVPLPPYITKPLDDPERYQTVFAREAGSAAAPTAGLHFTSQLLEKLRNHGVILVYVTLHVGLDTFAPVVEYDPRDHMIHSEWCRLDEQAAKTINKAKAAGGRIIAVGTTSVRVLETAAAHVSDAQVVVPHLGLTDLFLLPGYQFKAVDIIITNFHLPRSTLLMLISAFTGRKQVLAAYDVAKNEGYRFYSFGDAMIIL